MGQYFKAVVINGDSLKTFSPWGYRKIMEHAHLMNATVNQVMEEILDKPSKVLWVGDGTALPEDTFGMASHEDWMALLSRIRNTKDEPEWDCEEPEFRADISYEELKERIERLTSAMLVNHTKHCFIDLSKLKGKPGQNGDIIHPLPLLTALGNGRGGGCYYGTEMEQVGSWAHDIIEVSFTKPEGFKESIIRFIEY